MERELLTTTAARFLGAAAVLCCLGGWQAAPAAAGGFDLRVNDVSGLAEAWPLAGGLPFGQGELADAAALRVMSEEREMPAQIDVTATWRDGSVRWALASFAGRPGDAYRVEYGPGVSRRAPAAPLRVSHSADGGLVVDTGAATYAFRPDRLLPENAYLGGTTVLVGSGDGAYLVDNRGRSARVAGPGAEVTSEVVREGPARVVVRREGWYVTAAGERLARARAWFYFAAGSPFLRVTHSLILTEDTNQLWVRDYGLEFRTPGTAGRAVFALGDPGGEELFAADPAGGEVYLRQDTYPHFLERESRAVVGRAAGGGDEVLAERPAAGDWAHADFGGWGLTVVMPWLSRMFPKEIAFGPGVARAVFWSGRAGRELDFRAETLVKEYWQSWTEQAPDGAAALARTPSNAQGAARTHDIWLLPTAGAYEEAAVRARAHAAARPPLVSADPVYLCATEAIGWPMHPYDEAAFPREEAFIANFWDGLMRGYQTLPMTGFIAWGCNPYIRGSSFFRLSRLVDYGMRRHAWGLFGRSGDRRYYEYGARFNRFAGDWEVAHWTAGKKYAGGFAIGSTYNTIHLPFTWGDASEVLHNDISGHDLLNWLLEYYFTGDEYALELTRMFGEAIRERWNFEEARRGPAPFMIMRVLTVLYTREWDDDFRRMAAEMAEDLVDPESPNGLTDKMPYGALYKVDRNALALYDYYRATGWEPARETFLKAVDYQYRFNRVPPPISYQNAAGLLFTIAYRWTKNPGYLRLVNQQVAWAVDEGATGGGPHVNMHPTLGMPAALGLLAEFGRPADPYPLLQYAGEPNPAPIIFRKAETGRAVEIALYARLEDENAAAAVTVAPFGPGGPGRPLAGVRAAEERVFKTYSGDARARHIRLTVPAAAPAGLYALALPGAELVLVQESDGAELALVAPEGLQVRGDGTLYYFRVPVDLEYLEMNLGRPMEVRAPDGAVAVEANNLNIGAFRVPVEGRGGLWTIYAVRPGYARLLNTEPVLAAGNRERLPAALGIRPAALFTPPAAGEFAPGRAGGQALYLAGNWRVRFARGEKTAGGYRNFPGDEGTVEFWFRPDWSSTDLAVTSGSLRDFNFFRAGSHDFQYRYGERGWSRETFANLCLWLRGTKGNQGGESNIGFLGRHFFRAGRWYHLAVTWRLAPAERGTSAEYGVFIDGRPVAAGSSTSPSFPGTLAARQSFALREADEWVVLGPLGGALEQLRVSGTVRYQGGFTPPARIAGADEQTLAFFPLDGSYAGVAGTGDALTLEPAP